MRLYGNPMLESVPPLVETAIYCYFAVVAAIGCYLHGRLWMSYRSAGAGVDETPRVDG